jgi:hypothetical protein
MDGKLLQPSSEDVMQPAATAQIGDRVSFRIADVFLPEPPEVLANLTADVETHGVVEEFSDSGDRPRAYALVRITMQQAVLIPVAALHVLKGK